MLRSSWSVPAGVSWPFWNGAMGLGSLEVWPFQKFSQLQAVPPRSVLTIWLFGEPLLHNLKRLMMWVAVQGPVLGPSSGFVCSGQ